MKNGTFILLLVFLFSLFIYHASMTVLDVSEQSIRQAAEAILSGGVVAHATETCYGLACDLTNVQAVEKLFRIKDRPFSQPVSALFASVAEAKRYVEWNETAEELARDGLPGPLTIVVERKVEKEKRKIEQIYILPTTDLSKQPTIGIRVSPHPVAIRLCALVGRPIATTSANVHGESNPYSTQEIVRQYQDRDLQPDLVLESGELEKNASSRVVVIQNGAIRTVRG